MASVVHVFPCAGPFHRCSCIAGAILLGAFVPVTLQDGHTGEAVVPCLSALTRHRNIVCGVCCAGRRVAYELVPVNSIYFIHSLTGLAGTSTRCFLPPPHCETDRPLYWFFGCCDAAKRALFKIFCFYLFPLCVWTAAAAAAAVDYASQEGSGISCKYRSKHSYTILFLLGLYIHALFGAWFFNV